MSSLALMNAMVTSPGIPPGVWHGRQKRNTDSGRLSEYMGRARTFDALKYFQPRIFLAAAGWARMVVCRRDGSS